MIDSLFATYRLRMKISLVGNFLILVELAGKRCSKLLRLCTFYEAGLDKTVLLTLRVILEPAAKFVVS
jgi:hypothetical protein